MAGTGRTSRAPLRPTPNALPNTHHSSLTTHHSGWGWLPLLSLVGACGLLLVAVADTGARGSAGWAEPLFWAGVLVVYAPITARLAAAGTGRRESVGLAGVLGLELYAVKVLHSPLAFTHHDELAHWRTVINILAGDHLFGNNPILPVSALFPGLESVTTALMHLSGLSVFGAGVVVIGVARLVLILALYLTYEALAGSSRVAGVAVALYMGNPNFVFFNAMFKYESLALALAALGLFALVRRDGVVDISRRRALTAMALVALGAVVITHHLTAYILTALLFAWAALGARLARRGRPRPGPGWMALALLAANLAWLVFVAGATISYLAPVFGNAITGMARLLSGASGAGRTLFVSSSGQISPRWEQVTTFAAVGLIMIGLALGLREVWRRHRSSAIVATLAAATLAYPLVLPLRLTATGWETSNRSSEFLFVAIGLVVALGVVGPWRAKRLGGRAPLLLAGCASIIFAGGIIEGWPPLWRLPGPYLPAQDTRSVEPEGITAAAWARAYLGPHNRVGADRTNHLLMGTYGDQDVSTNLSGGVDVNWILYAPRLSRDVTKLLVQAKLRYLVVDRRLVGAPQVAQPYYGHAAIAPALAKFDRIGGVSRIFDSGDIQIYDVGALDGQP